MVGIWNNYNLLKSLLKFANLFQKFASSFKTYSNEQPINVLCFFVVLLR